MRDLTLRSLRVFDAAASLNSYSRAAEVLGMTQSAVSQQIKALENDINGRLFDTQARPIELTDQGRELLRHARLILAQVNIAADSLVSMGGQFRGQLHIGAVPPSEYFIAEIVAAFRARFPDVRIKVSLGRREELLALLAECRLDVVVGGYPPGESEIEAEAFARHPHCIVAAANHPLAGRRGIEWSELRDEPFIAREAGSATRKFLEHLMQIQGMPVNVNVELSGNEAVKRAVVAGLGIAFLSAHVFQLELQVGALKILDVVDMPKWLDWCVLTRRESVVPAVRQAFRDFLLAEGANYVKCKFASQAFESELPVSVTDLARFTRDEPGKRLMEPRLQGGQLIALRPELVSQESAGMRCAL